MHYSTTTFHISIIRARGTHPCLIGRITQMQSCLHSFICSCIPTLSPSSTCNSWFRFQVQFATWHVGSCPPAQQTADARPSGSRRSRIRLCLSTHTCAAHPIYKVKNQCFTTEKCTESWVRKTYGHYALIFCTFHKKVSTDTTEKCTDVVPYFARYRMSRQVVGQTFPVIKSVVFSNSEGRCFSHVQGLDSQFI